MSAALTKSAPIEVTDGVHAYRTGRALIDGVECQCGELVRPEDLVAADFDRRHVHSGGALYLLVAVENDEIVWRGCRQLCRVPEGISIFSGYGAATTMAALPDGWHVVATVEKVYRPTCSGGRA